MLFPIQRINIPVPNIIRRRIPLPYKRSFPILKIQIQRIRVLTLTHLHNINIINTCRRRCSANNTIIPHKHQFMWSTIRINYIRRLFPRSLTTQARICKLKTNSITILNHKTLQHIRTNRISLNTIRHPTHIKSIRMSTSGLPLYLNIIIAFPEVQTTTRHHRNTLILIIIRHSITRNKQSSTTTMRASLTNIPFINTRLSLVSHIKIPKRVLYTIFKTTLITNHLSISIWHKQNHNCPKSNYSKKHFIHKSVIIN